MDSRLVLGTVQFGLGYGIANRVGQVGRDEVARILLFARAIGIHILDTAVVYGDSERCLGELGVNGFKIVSKLPAVPQTCMDVGMWVQDSVRDSIRRLGISRLYGLLLHRSRELLAAHGAELYRALLAVKRHGEVEKIGVSIYGPEELDALGDRFELDLVQAPFNVLDRRLVTSGWLERLHRSGSEIHARSVFLQGLLLMNATQRPAAFDRWRPLLDQWDRWLKDHERAPLRACLEFVLSQPGIDRVVVGVDDLEQLHEIDAVARTAGQSPAIRIESDDVNLLEPSRWIVP